MKLMLNAKRSIYIAGHTGLIGSAFVRRLTQMEHPRLLTAPRSEVDLTNTTQVNNFFNTFAPQIVILCAGRVGGIVENRDHPVEFITQNLKIQLNVIEASTRLKVEKFLFIGSSCMYPRVCPQPIPESALLTGVPETTSFSHSLAKLAGLYLCLAHNQEEQCKRFLPVISTNCYGPNQDFGLQSSHVVPALIRRFHEAKERKLSSVTLWGTGTPQREFIHVDDLVDACCFLLQKKTEDLQFPINIGTGKEHSIKELAQMIADIVGYEGSIAFDPSMPDGTLRKLVDSSRIRTLGWKPRIGLKEGIRTTYRWYLDQLRSPPSSSDRIFLGSPRLVSVDGSQCHTR